MAVLKWMEKLFGVAINLPKAKTIGFELYKISLVDEISYKIYFYTNGKDKCYRLWTRKTEDGKRRAREDKEFL